MSNELCDGTCNICGTHQRPIVHAAHGLSQRELQVGMWLCRGKTNAEIATIIGCSLYTVKNHTGRIYAKLGVPNRVGACAQLGHLFPPTGKAPQ